MQEERDRGNFNFNARARYEKLEERYFPSIFYRLFGKLERKVLFLLHDMMQTNFLIASFRCFLSDQRSNVRIIFSLLPLQVSNFFNEKSDD